MWSVLSVVSTAIQTLHGIVSGPRKLLAPMFRAKATTIRVPGENDPHPIVKGQPIHVPTKTARITVHGTYFVHPHATNYALFVRTGKSYWAHDRAEFAAHGNWQANVGFGKEGEHFIILASISPELEVLRSYYRKVVHQIESDKVKLAAKLQDDLKHVVATIGSSTAIEVEHYLPGLKRIQEFAVIVGE